MYLVVVEDDPLQAEQIVRGLSEFFPGTRLEVIRTESEFRDHLDGMERTPPDVILLDIMLRWSDPTPDMPEPPADVREEGMYRAGFRCQRLMATRERLKDIPVIFYSSLEEEDVKGDLAERLPHIEYCRKDSDLDELTDKIRAMSQRRHAYGSNG